MGSVLILCTLCQQSLGDESPSHHDHTNASFSSDDLTKCACPGFKAWVPEQEPVPAKAKKCKKWVSGTQWGEGDFCCENCKKARSYNEKTKNRYEAAERGKAAEAAQQEWDNSLRGSAYNSVGNFCSSVAKAMGCGKRRRLNPRGGNRRRLEFSPQFVKL